MRYLQPFTNTIHLLTRCNTSLKGWAETHGWSYGCFLKLHQVRHLGLQTLGNKPWCCISYKKEKNGQGQRKSKVELLQLIRAQAHEPAKCPRQALHCQEKLNSCIKRDADWTETGDKWGCYIENIPCSRTSESCNRWYSNYRKPILLPQFLHLFMQHLRMESQHPVNYTVFLFQLQTPKPCT